MTTIQRLAELAKRPHDTCEDNYYSCPKSPDGCANDQAGSECNCGADEHNAEVAEVLALLVRENLTGDIAPWVKENDATVHLMIRACATPTKIIERLAEEKADLLKKMVELSMIAPKKITLPDGSVAIYHCPDHLVPNS